VSNPTPNDVRVFLAGFLNHKLKERAQGPLNHLPDDYDLLLSGLLDSLAFVEMITAAGEHFQGRLDFEGLDPEKLTIVGPLCVFVSEQLRERARPLCDEMEKVGKISGSTLKRSLM
jgi:acyl carrier protein